jgi:hypothetical protein
VTGQECLSSRLTEQERMFLEITPVWGESCFWPLQHTVFREIGSGLTNDLQHQNDLP